MSTMTAPDPTAATNPEHSHRALSGAVRVVSSVTLMSRLGGMVRDVLITRVFGVTAVGSAFLFAFRVPNTFRRLFGEGALSAAFVPEYARAVKSSPAEAGPLASLTILALAIVSGALSLLIGAGLGVTLLVAPPDPDRTLSLQLTAVMTLYMPPICIAAILAGMLQVHGRFGPASSGPLLLNLLMSAVGVYFLLAGQRGGPAVAFTLAAVVVASGVSQCVWFIRLLRPHVRWSREFAPVRPRVDAMLKRFVPVLIGMGTLQFNTFLDMAITMWPIWVGPTLLGAAYPLDKGSTVVLSNAERLYQFPLGVFGIAVATAVFPLLSRHADEPAHFIQTLRRGLRLSVFIGLPSSIGLLLVRHEVIHVLYSGGRSGLKAESLVKAAAALAGFAPGVWAYSVNHVLTRSFYAKGDTRTPMRVSMVMVVLNFGLNFALIWPLHEAGLAWATSISATVQTVVLGALCRRRIVGSTILDQETLVGFLRVAAAAVVMGAGVLAAAALLPAPESWSAHLASLVALCVTGGVLYLAAAAVLRCHEFGWLARRR